LALAIFHYVDAEVDVIETQQERSWVKDHSLSYGEGAARSIDFDGRCAAAGPIRLTLKSIEKFSFGHHGSRSLLTEPTTRDTREAAAPSVASHCGSGLTMAGSALSIKMISLSALRKGCVLKGGKYGQSGHYARRDRLHVGDDCCCASRDRRRNPTTAGRTWPLFSDRKSGV
jgi:hypothetical protein